MHPRSQRLYREGESSSTFSLSTSVRVRSLTKLWSNCPNQAGLINYKSRFWSYTAHVLTEMLSETYFSAPFLCNMIFFDTSWPLYRFLFQNGLRAKKEQCPTRSMSAHQRECAALRTLVVVGFLSFEPPLFPILSGHVAPISEIFASFYSISSPLLCKGQLSRTSSTKADQMIAAKQIHLCLEMSMYMSWSMFQPLPVVSSFWAGNKWDHECNCWN